MHLAEAYSLSSGLKIDKPYVYEHYTSLPYERFISFNRSNYPFFKEVINLIQPELDALGIKVLQLMSTPDTADTPVNIPKSLNFGQWAYIIKHSMLHFGEDNFLFDLAGFYEVPRVILFSNTHPRTTQPYFGDKSKERILANTGPLAKPSLSQDPNLNFVREIAPELVAKAIMELLNVNWKCPYETIFIGKGYRQNHDIIELIPSAGNFNVDGPMVSVVVRMDYNFNENFLAQVISKNKASIVTDKPINMQLLHNFRNNIGEIVYLINKDSGIDFVKDLARLNVPFILLSFEDREDVILEIKSKFFDVCTVNFVTKYNLDSFPKIKDNLNNLYYKSSKRILNGEQEYKTPNDIKISNASLPNLFVKCPTIDDEFLKELDFLFLIKLVA